MRSVRRQYKKVNSIVHAEGDEPHGDVAAVTVHDKQPATALSESRTCLAPTQVHGYPTSSHYCL